MGRRVPVIAACVATAVVMVTGGASAQSAVTVTDLGVAGTATAVNSGGTIVGNAADTDGEPKPFLWQRGSLATLESGPTSVVDITDDGRVLGARQAHYTSDGGDSLDYVTGSVWGNGSVTDLSPAWVFGRPADVTVTALNNAGVSLGHYDSGDPWDPRATVVLWDRSGNQTGPVPSPGAINLSLDLNDRGQVLAVGYHSHWCRLVVATAGTSTVVGATEYPDWEDVGLGCQDWARLNSRGEVLTRDQLWRAGKVTDLATIVGQEVTASAFSDTGHIVGEMTVDDARHAFLWDGRQLHDLGPGTATAVNNRGVVVGARDGRAVMWTVGNGLP